MSAKDWEKNNRKDQSLFSESESCKPRSQRSKREKKPFIIESRHIKPSSFSMLNEWHKVGSYTTRKRADTALAHYNTNGQKHIITGEPVYEYRLIVKGEKHDDNTGDSTAKDILDTPSE